MEWIILRMIPASLPFRYCSFSEREGRTSSRSRPETQDRREYTSPLSFWPKAIGRDDGKPREETIEINSYSFLFSWRVSSSERRNRSFSPLLVWIRYFLSSDHPLEIGVTLTHSSVPGIPEKSSSMKPCLLSSFLLYKNIRCSVCNLLRSLRPPFFQP